MHLNFTVRVEPSHDCCTIHLGNSDFNKPNPHATNPNTNPNPNPNPYRHLTCLFISQAPVT